MWTLGRLLILLAALGITYGAFFITAMRVTNKAREVKVPDVRGKTVKEAGQILASAGLDLKLDPTRVPDPKVAADHVLSQKPDPGTVLRRTRGVVIRVSDGMRSAPVPSVTGQPERTAELALEGARVPVLGRAEIRSSDYPPGIVVGQDPPAGARASGVTLLINRPEEGATYVAPDLVGLPYSRVVQVIRQFPFRLGDGGGFVNPNLPSGIIVQQNPPAGSQMRAQDVITVWTSK